MLQNGKKAKNIVFILADQLRADFLSCYGANFLDTPNIDRLAEKGTRFSNAYSNHPVCVPARCSLLTGLNGIRNGVLENGQFIRPDIEACGIKTWPHILSDSGYYTAAIGKMHFYPWNAKMGFDYRIIAEDKRWPLIRDCYYKHLRNNGLRKYQGNEHDEYYNNKGAVVDRLPWEFSIDHFVGEEACRFIKTYSNEKPFAMMVGFPGPHCPYNPSRNFLDRIDENAIPKSIPEVDINSGFLRKRFIAARKKPWFGNDFTEFKEEEKRKIRAHYAALVEQIDFEVGNILDALQETGNLDNTAIIFTSDHGDYLGDHNLLGKGSFYQSSIHIPLIVSIPNQKTNVLNNDIVSLTDVTATLLAIGKADIPVYTDSSPLPGLGLKNSLPKTHIYGILSLGWMAFDGRWKLCKYSSGQQHLFDLYEDPSEQENLYYDINFAKKRDELDRLLCAEIMRSIKLSSSDKQVYTADTELVQSNEFGYESWERKYPNPI